MGRICGWLAVACALTGVSSGAAPRPNVVVMLVDDVGFSDIGCFGGEIPTPHLDRLAAGGVRFAQFYNSARCSPSRAALLTGLNPHQAGLGWLDNKVEPTSRGFHGRLLPRCVTIAEVLRDAGYLTAMTGKWHLGQQHGTPPWKRGFTRALNSRYGEIYFSRELDRPGTTHLYLDGREIAKDSPELGADWYSTDLFVDWGLKFIDDAKARGQPFFLYVAQGAAHFPLRAPADVIAKHRERYLDGWDELRSRRHARQIEMGVVAGDQPLSPRPAESRAWVDVPSERRERFVEMMATYAAMIECVDRSVGALVAGLESRGLLDDTLILLVSDNGGNAEGGPAGETRGPGPIGAADSYVLLGMNWATLCNTPFVRYKHFTHEGGISSPCVVHWPRGIPAARRGSIEHQPAHLIDVMPTLLELTGAAYPTTRDGHDILAAEGVSLVQALAGEPLARPRPLCWEHEGNKAIREGRWKLVQKWRGPWELYDIDADRVEGHDRAAEHPDIVTALAGRWRDWAERTFVDDWPGPDHAAWGADIKPPGERTKAR